MFAGIQVENEMINLLTHLQACKEKKTVAKNEFIFEYNSEINQTDSVCAVNP